MIVSTSVIISPSVDWVCDVQWEHILWLVIWNWWIIGSHHQCLTILIWFEVSVFVVNRWETVLCLGMPGKVVSWAPLSTMMIYLRTYLPLCCRVMAVSYIGSFNPIAVKTRLWWHLSSRRSFWSYWVAFLKIRLGCNCNIMFRIVKSSPTNHASNERWTRSTDYYRRLRREWLAEWSPQPRWMNKRFRRICSDWIMGLDTNMVITAIEYEVVMLLFQLHSITWHILQ